MFEIELESELNSLSFYVATLCYVSFMRIILHLAKLNCLLECFFDNKTSNLCCYTFSGVLMYGATYRATTYRATYWATYQGYLNGN